MQIRMLSHHEIDTAVEFLQAMISAMASYGGHPAQEAEPTHQWLRDRILSTITATDHLFLVAELSPSGQLVGLLEASIARFPVVFQPKSSLHISAVYVQPSHRRSGIATSLMTTAFEWGREQGCMEADLNVLCHSPARSLYEELGFAPFQIEMRRTLL